eukprot:scaffold7530_cov144-Skeletonema_marinoi.AAC.2
MDGHESSASRPRESRLKRASQLIVRSVPGGRSKVAYAKKCGSGCMPRSIRTKARPDSFAALGLF